MAKDGNELRFIVPMIIICVLAIIALHWLYWPEFIVLLKDGIFLAAYILGVILFGYFSYRSYVTRDTGDNLPRVLTCVAAAFICIWIGTWCSQYRTDKSEGIEYKYAQR